jgi:WD40 repeat protein
VFGWDGEERNITIHDLNNMFTNIKGDHLNDILMNLSTRTIDQSSRSDSLLAPIERLFPSVANNKNDGGKLLSSILSSINLIFQLKSKHAQAVQRISTLSASLASYDDEGKWEGNATLRSIGQGHEYQFLQTQLISIESELQEEYAAREKLMHSAGAVGLLVSEASKGKSSTMLSWLSNRRLGVCGFNMPVERGVSRNLGPSCATVSRKIRTSYQMQWTISGHMLNPAYCVVFDKTGEYVITGADDFLVKVWNIRKGLLVHTLKGHQAYIAIVEVSPDNSIIASACTIGIIRLWSLRDGRCLKVLNHGSSVNWIKFDESSFALASVGDDGHCIVWDLTKILNQQAVHIDKVYDSLTMVNLLIDQSSDLSSSNLAKSGVHSPDTSIGATTSASISNDVEDAEAAVSAPSHIPTPFTFPGLFTWSNSSRSAEGKLVLPHIQDSLQVGGTNETIKIHCLDISPVGDILITGCDDGIARVWRFGDIDENERRTRSNLTAAEQSLLALKGLISPHEYQRMEFIASHLLQRLEGHISAITDLRFNNLGDRIVTGSLSDGTVRIWSFNHNYTKNEQVVLVLKDDDSLEHILSDSMTTSRRAVRQRQMKTESFNAAWTSDDMRVITLQSVVTSTSSALSSNSNKDQIQPTRLKVWDSMTGDLLRTIPFVGQVACKVLSTHPTDPTIAVTCGMDGFINVWNIEYESLVTSQHICDLDSVSPSNLVDASFSPDGQYLAVTDTIGRLTLIGLEPSKSDRESVFYVDQYFSSDYSDFVLDAEGNAIDAGTNAAMHEAPRGLLCRIDGYAYDDQPPKLLGPKALSVDDVKLHINSIVSIKENLRKQMDRVFGIFQKNRVRNRQTKHLSWNAIVHPQESSMMKSSRSFSTNNNRRESAASRMTSNVYGFDSFPASAVERAVQYLSSDDSSDDSNFRSGGNPATNLRRSGRQLRLTARSQQSNAHSQQNASSSGRILSTRESRAASRASRRESSRRRIIIDDTDDEDLADDAHTVTDSEDSSANIMSDGDSDSNNEANLSDGEGHHRRSSKRLRKIQKRENSRRKRSSRRGTEGENSMERSSSRRISKRSHMSSPEIGWGILHRGKKTIAIDADIDRFWLQEDQTFDSQYAPQLGDRVIYFPQGHIELLHHFAENSRPPWHSFPHKWPLVECTVKDISYEFPSRAEHRRCQSILVVLTLNVISIPLKPQLSSSGEYHVDLVPQRHTRHSVNVEPISFKVTIRNCSLPDFLIPSHVFNRCLKLTWCEGIKVSVTYREPVLTVTSFSPTGAINTAPTHERQEREYSAHVIRLANSSSDWPHSPWAALQIQFDDPNIGTDPINSSPVEYIGPWEAVPALDTSGTYGRAVAKNPKPSLSEDVSTRILQEVRQLMETHSELYEPFAFEVDSSIFPEYYCTIPVPMYVDLIIRRLENGFYRQVSFWIYNFACTMVSMSHETNQPLLNRIIYDRYFAFEDIFDYACLLIVYH